MQTETRPPPTHAASAERSVALLTVLLAVAAGALLLGPLAGWPPLDTEVPAWLVLALFAASELLVVDIPVRSETHSVSLSEIPLTLALFYLSPVGAVATQVVGTAAALVTAGRQRGVKLAFNVTQVALQGTIAVIVFRTILGDAAIDGPRAWFAALAAAVTADVVSWLLVTVALWLFGETIHRDVTTWALVTGVVAALAKASVALLGVIAIEQAIPGALVLLLIVTAVVYLAFRSYANLHLRHQRVEKLYRFTRALAGSLRFDDVAASVLREARELLRAEHAELALHGGTPCVARLGPGEEVEVEDRSNGVDPDPPVESATGVVAATRPSGDPALDAWLGDRGWEEVLAAPLRNGSTAGWLVVADRLGEGPGFGRDDARLFEVLANHAGVALENSRLVDELGAEVSEREHRASHDALTDLVNRTRFVELVAGAVAAAGADAKVAVMVVGLDHFREINETLGHDHGDEVLREAASRLGDHARAPSVAARLGGDEFAFLVPDSGELGSIRRLAEAIVHEFEQPFQVADLVVEIGASVGIACYPGHADVAATLLQRAEVALRAAKADHTRVAFYDARRDPHSPRQLVLAHELRRALDARSLEVYAQPKLSFASGTIDGVEVLVRWPLADGSFVPPDEFVPVAERTGLIRSLTGYVLDRALEHRRLWVAAGHEVDIAVNVSVRDLVDPTLVEQVAIALTRAVCPAPALTLEITESLIMSEPTRVAAALRRLAQLGVRVSIDDFGTGYSSMSALRELPLDEIKIDRTFVAGVAADEHDAALVRSITDLGHNLGLRVVAEGVEDDATMAELRAAGVDVAQGFGIARPMPAAVLPAWLATSGYEGVPSTSSASARNASRAETMP